MAENTLDDLQWSYRSINNMVFSHESQGFFLAMRDGLFERFRSLDPSGQMEANFRAKVLDKGELPMPWVLQAISRVNQKIRLGLPNAYWVPFYLISAVGKRGRKCYGIKLEGRKIGTSEVMV